MAEITVTFPGGELKVVKFDKAYAINVRKALHRMGAQLERHIKKNLSGESHSRFPGTANPYPGVLTGRLRSSVNYKVSGAVDSMEMAVGPNTVYAAIQEYGGNAGRNRTTRIPGRPYVGPAWSNNADSLLDDFQATIMEPLDR